MPQARPLLLLAALFLAAAGAEDAASDSGEDDVLREFVSLQRAKAAAAFEELFGDGVGLDGEQAPPQLETFVENYVIEALNRETNRILKEKGYVAEPQQKRDLLDVDKKDAPTTLEGEIERLAVQKRQRRAVRERVRTGKALHVLEPSPRGEGATAAVSGRQLYMEVPCGEPLYGAHVYGAVPGCSPGLGPGELPCGRLVLEDFATRAEQEQMISMMDGSFQGLFHQGAETLLVPEADSEARMGAAGFKLTTELLERAREAVARRLNLSQVFYSGSLLKRMDQPPLADEMQLEPDHDSSNPHVDKANIASYDWSCLLYFSSVGQDFGGGELLFHDADADRMVRPLAGRLVAFSSGLESLHRVLPMTWGRRYVLSMWFTCSERHAHPSLGGHRGAPSAGAARREL